MTRISGIAVLALACLALLLAVPVNAAEWPPGKINPLNISCQAPFDTTGSVSFTAAGAASFDLANTTVARQFWKDRLGGEYSPVARSSDMNDVLYRSRSRQEPRPHQRT